MSLIEIEHLTYSYPGAENPTLNDISIQIEKGDFLAIVGHLHSRRIEEGRNPQRSLPYPVEARTAALQ